MKLLIPMVAFVVAVFTANGIPRYSYALSRIAVNNQLQTAGPEDVINAYFHIKNALASDNAKDAASAGKELQTALTEFGKQPMNATQKKAFADIAKEVANNAAHISKNADNIKQQREYFLDLSNNMYDLVKAFGSPQTLYKAYCSMAKGMWLSETKTIKNPYYGNEMSACGELKETIKPGK